MKWVEATILVTLLLLSGAVLAQTESRQDVAQAAPKLKSLEVPREVKAPVAPRKSAKDEGKSVEEGVDVSRERQVDSTKVSFAEGVEQQNCQPVLRKRLELPEEIPAKRSRRLPGKGVEEAKAGAGE